MKSKKLIGTMALFISITGSIGGIANATSIDSTITAQSVSVNKISTKYITDKEFSDVVGIVEKEQNLPIIKDLMKKAKNYLGNGFYVERKVTCEGGEKESGTTKLYWENGNCRSEEFDTNNNLLYLTVYNKAEDTEYNYDAKNNSISKTTNVLQKYCLAYNRTKYNFLCLDSARFGDLKTIDYNNRKAVHSTDISVYENKLKVDTQILYDAETGMILNFQQKCFNSNGTLDCNYISDSYIIKPNQTFDSSIFKYDENNKSAVDLKLN